MESVWLWRPVIGNNHNGETLYEWKNHSGDGWGMKRVCRKRNSLCYKGEVKNGVPNGLGFIIYPDGGMYFGSWKNSKKSKGTMTYFYGRKYVGEWLNGKEWNGTFHKPNGNIDGKYVNWKSIEKYEDKYVGNWKDKRPWNGIVYDKDGNILLKFLNGKSVEWE